MSIRDKVFYVDSEKKYTALIEVLLSRGEVIAQSSLHDYNPYFPYLIFNPGLDGWDGWHVNVSGFESELVWL